MPDIRYASNSIDDFEQGALYPGGSGTVKEFRYKLWDYNGNRPPDSEVAVYLLFSPTDGSNDGKDVEIYWSVGPATDFAIDPEGGRLIITKESRKGQGSSSNWGFVLEKLRDTCGLSGADQGKYFNTPKGIRVVEGSDMTLARIDQPKREGLEQDEKTKEKQSKYKPTILVPVRVKWPWEKGAKKSSAAVPSTTASAASRATMGQNVTESAAPSSNGEPSDLASSLAALLAAEGGSVAFAEIPAKLLDRLVNMERAQRMAILKEAKSADTIKAVAESNGWIFNGTDLVAV